MKLHHLLLLVVLSSVPLTLSASAPQDYPDLPSTLYSPSYGYVVHYDDVNASSLDYLPEAQAQRMANACNTASSSALGDPNGFHTGFVLLGFPAPPFTGAPSGTRPIYVYDWQGGSGGTANADSIEMPAPIYKEASEHYIRSCTGHELFHMVQWAYITREAFQFWNMPSEGTAYLMEDKIYNDLDACVYPDCKYEEFVHAYLNTTNNNIWEQKPKAGLFWNYLAEQMGTDKAEPTGGADFIKTFWERAQANNDPADQIKAVREAIAHYDTSRSLEGLFQDFTITNFTKLLNLSKLSNPDRYRYRDENDGTGVHYIDVKVGINGSIPFSGSNLQVAPWGALYIKGTACPSGAVGFRSSGDQAAYALVTVSNKAGQNYVEQIYKSTTSKFARTVVQDPLNPYTYLTAVVTGLNNTAVFSYTFGCGPVNLEIREPKSPDTIAYVGAFDAPEPFLIKLRVQGPANLGTPSVEGLDEKDFLVYVGDVAPENKAEVITGAYVQGDYWLVTRPLTKTLGSVNPFNLTVKLAAVNTATNEGAVRFETKSIDQALVIDASGSMSDPPEYPKIDAAKIAAQLYVDSVHSVDQTAVITFNGNLIEPDDDATLEDQLKLATPANREAAKEEIGWITTHWLTSIGDGLEKAHQELVHSGRGRPSPPTERWVVLLSDGMENESLYWADVADAFLDDGIHVNAIGLGPESNQQLLNSIAISTTGNYHYVDLPPGYFPRPGLDEPQWAPSLAMKLSDAYALAAEDIQGHQRLWEHSDSLTAEADQTLLIAIEEAGVQDALFTVAWSGGSMAEATVWDPSGTQVVNGVGGAEVFTDANHATFRVPTLTPDAWQVRLKAGLSELQYHAILSGRSRQGVQLRLFFGAYSPSRDGLPSNLFLLNQPMPILASLTDGKGPVLGIDHIIATIEHPDGSRMELHLYDDGNHNDGLPNDGVYGVLYARTTVGSKTAQEDTVYSQRGSYNVVLTAAGTNNSGDDFTRIAKGSFAILDPLEPGGDMGDTDTDGLTNLYEKLHPCLDYQVYDSEQDLDYDGLSSWQEYELGTDPCNADTDNGGESDGSEVGRGSSPWEITDDALPQPITVEVIHQVTDDQQPFPDLRPNANLILYPGSPEYHDIRLLRSGSPDGLFEQVAEFNAHDQGGQYYDEGLTNGETYYYMVVGVSASGATSAPSHIFSGTPKEDPYPPVGVVIINHHAAYVNTTAVTLQLLVATPPIKSPQQKIDYDASEVLIGNDPLFTGLSWQPYAPEIPWTLAPDPVSGRATVFVMFRDLAGNQSETFTDGVFYKAPINLGSIHLKVWLHQFIYQLEGKMPGDEVAPGTVVLVKDNKTLPVSYTDEAGDALLEGIPPGFYDLWIERDGFRPLILTNVQVIGGQETDLGEVELEPWRLLLPIVEK